jgi:alpha-beta hydrolase superfamily lysophospholipase
MSTLGALDVESADSTRIRVWRRVPEGATEAVLFVHGATYGGRAAFAPEGYSWLDDVAAAGRAAYTLDARGYGDSERPPELDAPAEDGDPVVRAETAAQDAMAALDAVRDSFGTVHLVGYSWGSMIAGVLLDDLGAEVTSLVQYAPVYSPAADREADFSPGDPPAAYRTVTGAETRERWTSQRPGPVPEGAFDAFWETLLDSGQHAGEGRVVAPNGTLVDLTAAVDEPVYDPGAIDVPTLVVRGSLDTASRRPDALALYDAVGADDRVYTEVAGGTHFMQFESVRERLVGAVRAFHDRLGGDGRAG